MLTMNSMAVSKMWPHDTSQDVKGKGHRAWIWVCFLAYLFVLFYMLFFAEAFGRTGHVEEYRLNLTPFQEIRRFYQYGLKHGWHLFWVNVIGNIVVFIPFGMFLPRLSPKCKNLLLTALLSLEFSLAIEIVQLISRVGSFDVDDLLLNTIGGVFGCILFSIGAFVWRKGRTLKDRK